MKRLHRVTVEFDYVVVVDEGDDPYLVAESYARDAFLDISTFDMNISTTPYHPKSATVTGWDNECIPYGGDGNTRTGEYLKEIQ